MLSNIEFNRILEQIFDPANNNAIHRLQLALRQNELNFEQKRKLADQVERMHSKIHTGHLVWLFVQAAKHYSYIAGDLYGFDTYFKDNPLQINQSYREQINYNNTLFEHGMVFQAMDNHSSWAKVECALHKLNKGNTNVGLQWLQEAAKTNNEWAKTELAKYCLDNNKELMAYQLLLEITYHTDAMIYLGNMYQEKHMDRAIECYYKAAVAHNHHGIALLKDIAFNNNNTAFRDLAKMYLFIIHVLNENSTIEQAEKYIFHKSFEDCVKLLSVELTKQLQVDSKNFTKESLIKIFNCLNKQAVATNNIKIISAIIKLLAVSTNYFPDLIDDNSLHFKPTPTKLLMNDTGRELLIAIASKKLISIDFDKLPLETLQNSFNMLEEVYIHFINYNENELTSECVYFMKSYREKISRFTDETLKAVELGIFAYDDKLDKLRSLKNCSKFFADALMKCYEHDTNRYYKFYEFEKYNPDRKDAYLDKIIFYASEGCEIAIKYKNELLEKEVIALHQEALNGNKQSLDKLQTRAKKFAVHQYYLALYYEQKPIHHRVDNLFNSNSKKAFACYQSAAKMGHGAAYTKIGLYYKQGLGGVKIDHDKALDYFYQAAQKENPEGLVALKQLSCDDSNPSTAIKANIYQAIRTHFNHFHYIEDAFNISEELTTKILWEFSADTKLNLHIRLQLLQAAYKNNDHSELQQKIQLAFINLLTAHLKINFSPLKLLNRELQLIANYINPIYFTNVALMMFFDLTIDIKLRILTMCAAEHFIISANVPQSVELKYFFEIMMNVKQLENFTNTKDQLTFIPSAPLATDTNHLASSSEIHINSQAVTTTSQPTSTPTIPSSLSKQGITETDIKTIEDDLNTPKTYLDPVSFELLLDPVVMNDGNTYNRNTAITLINNASPLNPFVTLNKDFYPNNSLRSDILTYIENYKKQCTTTSTMNDNNKSTLETTKKIITDNPSQFYHRSLTCDDQSVNNNSLRKNFH